MNSILLKYIEEIKRSPMFYLFVSSRELFHTNFWYWLSTLNKAETVKLFTDTQFDADLFFKREHRQCLKIDKVKKKANIDLLICDDKNSQALVAIENKIKDFAKEEQLTKIRDAFSDDKIEFIVTTLFSYADLESQFKNWKIKTYKEIAEAINASAFTTDSYYQNLIEDYKRFTANLALLAEEISKQYLNDTYNFAITQVRKGKDKAFESIAKDEPRNLFELLDEIKMWESYQKFRASHLLYHFSKTTTNTSYTTYHSLNNRKATIGFEYKIKGDDKLKVGIQIEDQQFRKFVRCRNAESIAVKLFEKKILFNDTFEKARGRRFLKYDTTFRYQYEKIGQMTFDELFEKIDREMNKIINLEDKIVKLI